MLVLFLVRDAGKVSSDAWDLLQQGRGEFALGMVKSPAEALEVASDTGEFVLVVPVRGPEDPILQETSALVGKGGRILVVADRAEGNLRGAALELGARDVVIGPLDRALLFDALGPLLGREIRPPPPCSKPIPAVVTGSKLPPRNVTVEALSRRACSFRTATEVAEGTLIRLGLDAPGYPVPGLFGRVVSRQGEDHLTALVALTAEERTALGALVDSMGPELEDVATGLAFLEDLDLVKLKAALAEGQRLPALTRLERAGVESGDPPLSRIAVARCRALLLGTLHGSASARGHRLPRQIPLPRWWKEISEARDTIADLCRREDARSPGAPTEALKELRDLESRVWVAVETVDRVGVAVFGRHLDPMVQSATTQVSLQPIVPAPDLAAGLAKEESPSPTPAAAQERPSLRLVLWGLAIAAGLGAAFATRSWLIGDHGEKPLVGIQAEAPAFVEGKIRFRTVFDQRRANAPDPVRIAVVDNSWMGASRAEKTDAVKSLARDLHLKPLQRLEVRDYSGRLRAAWIEPSAR